MKKKQIQLEYIFESVSRASLWNHVATPLGLSQWFADKVESTVDCYQFFWGNDSSSAIVSMKKDQRIIRFRWEEEEDEDAYFEFRIHTIELTGDVVLEISDYCYEDEKSDSIDLWDAQISTLKRTLGV